MILSETERYKIKESEYKTQIKEIMNELNVMKEENEVNIKKYNYRISVFTKDKNELENVNGKLNEVT